MATPVEIAVRTSGTAKARSDLRGVSSEVRGTSQSMQRLANAAKVGAALAGAAVIKLGVDSVQAASLSEQSIGATRTVFGKYADDVIKRSRDASQAIGVSANEYRELANATGAMLSSTGLPLRRTAELTAQLNKRGADLAATFGGTTREAIEAMGSLLRGEADPIERYGVSIKQSDVNARLAAQGLDELTGKALKQAEQQARLKLLFEQTAKSAGQFKREGDTLAGQSQRLSASWDDLQAKAGKALLPLLTDLAEAANDKLLPALEDLAPSADQVKTALTETAEAVKPAWELLKDLGGVARETALFLNGLPGPVKDFAVQAGIAALVLPRLNTGFTNASTRAKTFVADLKNAETRTRMLGQAARGAAGLGGILALQGASSTSSKALQGLATVGGGALLGFAAGGPVGAAVGGTVGALSLLIGKSEKTSETLEAGKKPAVDYASSLDQITGAATKATRELVFLDLQQRGVFSSASLLSISARDVVSATLGQEGAQRRVSAAMADAEARYQGLINRGKGTSEAAHQLSNALGTLRFDVADVGREVGRTGGEVSRMALATKPLREILKGWPKEVRTFVRTQGIPDSVNDVKRMQRQLDLQPKEVRTLLKLLQVDESVQRLVGFRKGMVESLRGTQAEAKKGIDQIGNTMASGSEQAVVKATTISRSRSPEIGQALAAGAAVGVRSRAAQVANEAASMVINALARARHEAKIKSPSRKTREIGEQLAEGMRLGIRENSDKVSRQMRRLLQSLIKAAGDGGKGVRERLAAILEKVKVKPSEIRKITQQLDRQTAALVKNAAAQKKVNERLREARTRLRDLKQASADYAASVKQAALDYTSVTAGGSAFTATAIAASMQARLEKLRQFAALVKQLREQGLNQTSLDQIVAGGVEGGLAYADAIAKGGQDAIAEINDLQNQIGNVAGDLGSTAADNMYAAGISAAQALVEGLEARTDRLDAAAARIARRIVRQLRQELSAKKFADVIGRDLKTTDRSSARRAYEDSAARSRDGSKVAVRLTAEQASALQRGREIQLDLDAYHQAGGRTGRQS